MSSPSSYDGQATKRILVYRIGEIGDTVITIPALHALRNHFPSARLTLLTNTSPFHTNPLAVQVLHASELVDDYIPYLSYPSGPPLKEIPPLLREIRRRRFDALVYLAPRLRRPMQVLRDLSFFRAAGIRRFIGHRGFDRLPLSDSGQPLGFMEHEADHLLSRLRLSGIPVPSTSCGSMDLCLSIEERAFSKRWIEERIEDVKKFSLVAVGPGAKWPSKIWPADFFSVLIFRLIDEYGLYPIVFGGPEDRELGKRLIGDWGVGVNAAGELSIRQSAAVMEACQFYVGNDTGTMHLAAASGTKCVGIFSAQDYPGRWHPYGSGHIVLRRSISCEGCLTSVCKEGDLSCLRLIEVEDVFDACRNILLGR